MIERAKLGDDQLNYGRALAARDQRLGRAGALLLAGALALFSTRAWATSDLPSIASARGVGMIGVGTEIEKSAAAVLQNPALLDAIPRLDVHLTFNATLPYFRAPVGPSPYQEKIVEQCNSPTELSPLFLLGAAYRVHKRVVLGLAVFPEAGTGGTYENVKALDGKNYHEKLMFVTISPAIAVRILDSLSLGLAYRITYVGLDAHMMEPGMGVNLSTKGWNFLGLRAGVRFEPLKWLHFGFSYRNSINTDLSGDGTFGPSAMPVTGNTGFALGHEIRMGAAFDWLAGRATTVLNFSIDLYSGINDSIKFSLYKKDENKTPLFEGQEVVLGWQNMYTLRLAQELWVTPKLPLRAGFMWVTPSVTEEHAAPVGAAPAHSFGFSVGAGYRFTRFYLDLGALFIQNVNDNVPAHGQAGDLTGVYPGQYRARVFQIALGGGYQF